MYLPNALAILLYSNCEIVAIVEQKEDCGCTLTSTPPNDDPLNEADTHAKIVINSNWTYIVHHLPNSLSTNPFNISLAYSAFQSSHKARLYSSNIFHPPIA